MVLSGGTGGHSGLLQAVQRRLGAINLRGPQLVLSSLDGEAPLYEAIWLALQTVEAHGFRRRPVGIGSDRSAFLAETY